MLGLCYRFSEETVVKEPHRKYSCKQFNEAREMYITKNVHFRQRNCVIWSARNIVHIQFISNRVVKILHKLNAFTIRRKNCKRYTRSIIRCILRDKITWYTYILLFIYISNESNNVKTILEKNHTCTKTCATQKHLPRSLCDVDN